jgi:hypothetical protein
LGSWPPRRPSTSRRFRTTSAAVARLRFKHAQDPGFSLAEIAEKRIQDLRRLKRTLERLVAACAARQPTDEGPILESLEDRAIAR